MDIDFTESVFFWRGPSPYYFVRVPPKESEVLKEISKLVTYGWGMIPVTAELGKTRWDTSLFPKDGGYLLPLKDRVRKAEELEQGSTVSVRLEVRRRRT
ncbi:MAG: DUF1905 domain-containing protein [Candidatus Eisenbacteria bacterium]